MIWLMVAALSFALAAVLHARRTDFSTWARIAGYVAMVLGIILDFGSQAFQGSETSLIAYFAMGATIMLFANLLPRYANWAIPIIALMFAFGFDVFRPDPYSYVPASILGLLISAVAVRAYQRLVKGLKNKNRGRDRIYLAGYIFSVAFLTYAALFKMVDRGWALPWAYLSSAGALLFAASQLWFGWKIILRKETAPGWIRIAATDFGMLLMTIAAFFVYVDFI